MHESSSTHALHKPIMSPGLMDTTTQIKSKWILHFILHISIHKSTYCADVCVLFFFLQCELDHLCLYMAHVSMCQNKVKTYSRQPLWPTAWRPSVRKWRWLRFVPFSGPENLAGHHKTQRPQTPGHDPGCHAWLERLTNSKNITELCQRNINHIPV